MNIVFTTAIQAIKQRENQKNSRKRGNQSRNSYRNRTRENFWMTPSQAIYAAISPLFIHCATKQNRFRLRDVAVS